MGLVKISAQAEKGRTSGGIAGQSIVNQLHALVANLVSRRSRESIVLRRSWRAIPDRRRRRFDPCLRPRGDGRVDCSRLGRGSCWGACRGSSASRLLLVDRRLPLLHELFRGVGDLDRLVLAKLANCETRLALLGSWASAMG